MNTLGINLRRIRKSKGLTQKELAKLCGLAPSSIAQIETSRNGCRRPTLEAISRHLGCPVSDLTGEPPAAPEAAPGPVPTPAPHANARDDMLRDLFLSQLRDCWDHIPIELIQEIHATIEKAKKKKV
jgi:transcriptional regulator with XRE-family HTH domain